MWIDKETFFVLKRERRSPVDGHLVSLEEVTNIEYNPTLPDALFESPPHGPALQTFPSGTGLTTTLYEAGAPTVAYPNGVSHVTTLALQPISRATVTAQASPCSPPGITTVVNAHGESDSTVVSTP